MNDKTKSMFEKIAAENQVTPGRTEFDEDERDFTLAALAYQISKMDHVFEVSEKMALPELAISQVEEVISTAILAFIKLGGDLEMLDFATRAEAGVDVV